MEIPLRGSLGQIAQDRVDALEDLAFSCAVGEVSLKEASPRFRQQVLLKVAERPTARVELLERIVRPELLVDRLPFAVDFDARVGIAVLRLLGGLARQLACRQATISDLMHHGQDLGVSSRCRRGVAAVSTRITCAILRADARG